MDKPRTPADPGPILAVLEAEGVEYVVIGGWALVAYGVDRATFDLDVVVEPSDDNGAALASALRRLDARRDLGAGVLEDLNLDAPRSLFANPLRMVTNEGPLDVLSQVLGIESYEEVRNDARRAKFGDGTEFVIASKQTLEKIKQAMAEQADPERAGRDRFDLEELRRLSDPDLPPARR